MHKNLGSNDNCVNFKLESDDGLFRIFPTNSDEMKMDKTFEVITLFSKLDRKICDFSYIMKKIINIWTSSEISIDFAETAEGLTEMADSCINEISKLTVATLKVLEQNIELSKNAIADINRAHLNALRNYKNLKKFYTKFSSSPAGNFANLDGKMQKLDNILSSFESNISTYNKNHPSAKIKTKSEIESDSDGNRSSLVRKYCMDMKH